MSAGVLNYERNSISSVKYIIFSSCWNISVISEITPQTHLPDLHVFTVFSNTETLTVKHFYVWLTWFYLHKMFNLIELLKFHYYFKLYFKRDYQRKYSFPIFKDYKINLLIEMYAQWIQMNVSWRLLYNLLIPRGEKRTLFYSWTQLFLLWEVSLSLRWHHFIFIRCSEHY